MKRTVICITGIFALIFSGMAQTGDRITGRCAFGGDKSALELCLRLQQNEGLAGSYPDGSAHYTVKRILEAANLTGQLDFHLGPCSGISNAVATIVGGRRFILYNSSFMANIRENTDWASWGILAHEVGHHYYNHSLSDSSLAQKREEELQADHFAGRVLCQLNASLPQAESYIRAELDVENEDNSDHPENSKRIAMIREGYKGCQSSVPAPTPGYDPESPGFSILCGGNDNRIRAGESATYQIIINSRSYTGQVMVRLSKVYHVIQYHHNDRSRPPNVQMELNDYIESDKIEISALSTTNNFIRVRTSPDTPPGSYRLIFSASANGYSSTSPECILVVN